VVLDAGLWTRTAASVATPMSRPAPAGLFCPTLDEALAPFTTNGADVLSALCELDDPHGRRTTTTGGWR
jgi:hypothetical protein